MWPFSFDWSDGKGLAQAQGFGPHLPVPSSAAIALAGSPHPRAAVAAFVLCTWSCAGQRATPASAELVRPGTTQSALPLLG